MRRYYIISGILLILPIIDFAVAAPVLQKKHQAGVDVVHIPGHSITMLGKRFDDIIDFSELFRDTEDAFAKLDNVEKPESSSAARLPSSSQSLGLADGGTDVEHPLTTIPGEQFPVSSPADRASPSPGDKRKALWLQLFGSESDFAEPESSSPSRPSSSSPKSWTTDGGTDVKQPLPTIPGEQSPASSLNRASLNPGDGRKALWLELFGDSESPSASRPSSSSPPSGTAEGVTDLKQHSPSIPEEPPPVGSTGYELMKGDAPPGPSGPASPTMSSADQELMGESSTNLDGQWMDSGSTSSGKRKRPW